MAKLLIALMMGLMAVTFTVSLSLEEDLESLWKDVEDVLGLSDGIELKDAGKYKCDEAQKGYRRGVKKMIVTLPSEGTANDKLEGRACIKSCIESKANQEEISGVQWNINDGTCICNSGKLGPIYGLQFGGENFRTCKIIAN